MPRKCPRARQREAKKESRTEERRLIADGLIPPRSQKERRRKARRDYGDDNYESEEAT